MVKGKNVNGHSQLLRWAIYGFLTILVTITLAFWKFSKADISEVKNDISGMVSQPIFDAHEKAFEEYKKVAGKNMANYDQAFSEFRSDTSERFRTQNQRFEKRIDKLERGVEKQFDKLDTKMDRILEKLP